MLCDEQNERGNAMSRHLTVFFTLALLLAAPKGLEAGAAGPDKKWTPPTNGPLKWANSSPLDAKKSGKPLLVFVFDSSRKPNRDAWNLMQIADDAEVNKAFAEFICVRKSFDPKSKSPDKDWAPFMGNINNSAAIVLASCDLRPTASISGANMKADDTVFKMMRARLIQGATATLAANSRVKDGVAKEMKKMEEDLKKKQEAEAKKEQAAEKGETPRKPLFDDFGFDKKEPDKKASKSETKRVDPILDPINE
jgi:hypothetical protein